MNHYYMPSSFGAGTFQRYFWKTSRHPLRHTPAFCNLHSAALVASRRRCRLAMLGTALAENVVALSVEIAPLRTADATAALVSAMSKFPKDLLRPRDAFSEAHQNFGCWAVRKEMELRTPLVTS